MFGELVPVDDIPQEGVGLLGERLLFPAMLLSTKDPLEITKALGITSQEVTRPGALGLANPSMNLNGSGIASVRDVVCYEEEPHSQKEYSFPTESLHFDENLWKTSSLFLSNYVPLWTVPVHRCCGTDDDASWGYKRTWWALADWRSISVWSAW